MIAALLLRFGIPMWAAKAVAALLLAAAVVGAGAALHHHIYAQGEAAADARADAREKANSARANAELAKLNDKLAKKQADLNTVVADLIHTGLELSYEKRNSTALQSDLAAGRKRLSVLVRQRPADPAKSPDGACPAGVGAGISVAADLDGRVASDLEWARQTRNEAIAGLEACIVAYDAVKKAADAP